MRRETQPLKIFVIPHFHWDRAWFESFERFRIGLVETMDKVLDILGRREEYKFTLDGQTVILEDYLEIRPEQKAAIQTHVSEKRLSIGPWYVLPDEKIPCGESHIRNLLMGKQVAREYGGGACIGYAPDAFGHISQLPQIFRGFGIPSSFFMRGIVEGEYHTEFVWEAPNGDRVTVYNTPYGNAKELGRGKEYGYQYLLERIYTLAENTQTGIVGLMAGHDFREPCEEIIDLVQEAQNAGYNIRLATVEELLNEVMAYNQLEDLHRGECPPPEHNYREDFLPGVLSTRTYLKQKNDNAARQLLTAEQGSTFASLIEGEYPRSFLQKAWRFLLKCHPHDDICGCSKDVVHREDMFRLERVEELVQGLWKFPNRMLHRKKTGRHLRTLQRFHNNISQTDLAPGQPVVFVYNSLPWDVCDTVQTDIPIDEISPSGWQVVDSNNNPVHHAFQRNGESYTLRFVAEHTPACGFALYKLQERNGSSTAPLPASASPLETGEQTLENKYVKVFIRNDGSVDVLDKCTGERYEGGNELIDDEDAGNTYNHSYCGSPEKFTSKDGPVEIKLEENTSFRGVFSVHIPMRVPAALTASKKKRTSRSVTLRIVTRVILEATSPAVKFATTVVNNASDHRLTVKFPTGVASPYCFAEGHFDVMQRPTEMPEGIYPRYNVRNYVGVTSENRGSVLIPYGLCEYEASKEGGHEVDLHLTLLRGVGQLGGESCQAPRAGPAISTPEAQCLGTQTFYYAFMPCDASRWQKGAHRRTAYEHNTPLSGDYVLSNGNEGPLPQACGFLKLPEELILVSCKRGDDRTQNLFVRFWNPLEETVSKNIAFAFPLSSAYVTDLQEERRHKMHMPTRCAARVEVKPKQIMTVELVPDTYELGSMASVS